MTDRGPTADLPPFETMWKARIEALLTQHHAAPVRVSNMTWPKNGYSTPIVIFEARSGEAPPLNLVLRHEPEGGGGFSLTYNLKEQYEIQRLAAAHGIPAPKPLIYDDGAVLGVPGFIMQRMPGSPC